MNFVMLAIFALSGLAVLVRTKKALYVAIFLFGSVSASGLLLEISQFFFGLPTLFMAQIVISATSISLASAIFLILPKSKYSLTRSDITVFATVALLVGFLVLNRLIVSKKVFSPLAGVSRLVGGEDNGKWLNFTSAVELGQPVQMQGGVSAGLAVLLLLTVALMQVISILVLGGENQLAVTVQAVLVAHAALVVLSPLAISPLIELRSRRNSLWNISSTKQISASKTNTNNLSLFVAALFLAIGVAAPLGFGHLSLEFVLVALTFAVTSVLVFRDQPLMLFIATLIFSVAGLVWMPFTYLSIIATLLALIWSFRATVIPISRRFFCISGFALLFIATVIASLGDLIYLYGQSSDSGVPVKALLIAEGGTMQVDWAIAIVLVSCLGVFAFILSQANQAVSKKSLIIYASPIILLFGYFMAVAAYDSWSTSGGVHYGTRKLGYAVAVILIAALISILIERVSERYNTPTIMRIGLASGIAYLLLVSSLIPKSLASIGSGLWPTNDITKTTEWAQFTEISNSPKQDLADLPIGCLIENESGYQPGVGPGYLCTRQMISIKGMESEAHFLNDFLLHGEVQISEDFMNSIEGMSDKVKNSDMLIIDEQGKINRTVKVSTLIEEIKSLQH